MIKFLSSVAAAGVLFSATPALCQAPDNAIATGIDFDMDEAVFPAVQKYDDCLTQNRPLVINRRPSHSVAFERAIAACRHARTQFMAEANASLVRDPAWADQTKRAAEVTSVFDNIEASGRKLAREMDAYNARLGR